MALYFFSSLAGALHHFSEGFFAPARRADPIDHPDIAAMSLAELAGLPLGPDRGLHAAAESVDRPEPAAMLAAPLTSPVRLLDHGVVRQPAA